MEGRYFSHRIIILIFFVSLGLGWCAWSPRTLAQFEGISVACMTSKEAQAYFKKIQLTLKQGKPALLKERELNAYLPTVIAAKQSYILRPWIRVKGIFINLTPQAWEICLERELYNARHHLTISYAATQKKIPVQDLLTLQKKRPRLGKLLLPVTLTCLTESYEKQLIETTKTLSAELKPYVTEIELKEGAILLYPKQQL